MGLEPAQLAREDGIINLPVRHFRPIILFLHVWRAMAESGQIRVSIPRPSPSAS